MSLRNEMYNRQETLRLRTYESVLIVGVGGVGSWVALDMALSGKCSNLILIDDDKLSIDNLNRTPYRMCDVDSYKVDALKYLILERRTSVDVDIYRERTNEKLLNKILKNSKSYYRKIGLIIDCRDEIYQDLEIFNCKTYKVGYDGMSVTIDGNPRETKVWSTANGYRVTPSFVCPSQLLASLVVTDALMPVLEDPTKPIGQTPDFEENGSLNCPVTFNINELMRIVYTHQNKKEIK